VGRPQANRTRARHPVAPCRPRAKPIPTNAVTFACLSSAGGGSPARTAGGGPSSFPWPVRPRPRSAGRRCRCPSEDRCAPVHSSIPGDDHGLVRSAGSAGPAPVSVALRGAGVVVAAAGPRVLDPRRDRRALAPGRRPADGRHRPPRRRSPDGRRRGGRLRCRSVGNPDAERDDPAIDRRWNHAPERPGSNRPQLRELPEHGRFRRDRHDAGQPGGTVRRVDQQPVDVRPLVGQRTGGSPRRPPVRSLRTAVAGRSRGGTRGLSPPVAPPRACAG